MKKNYLFLAAATTLFAACVQNDVVNDIPEPQQQAISFETFANKATRAVDATKLSSHHENYAVWAYKSTQNDLVFDGEVVEAEDNEYTVTQYWDKAATSYNFYAAAPATGLTFNESESSGVLNKTAAYFTIQNLELSSNFSSATPSTDAQSTFKQTNMDVDYMIATTPVGENGISQIGETVNFTFSHILSRLNVTVKKSEANGTPNIILEKVTVVGLKNKADYASNGTGLGKWTNTSYTEDYVSIENYDITTTAAYVLECLLIPQTISYEDVPMAGKETAYTSPYIHIEYKIANGTDQSQNTTYETFDAYYNLAQLFGALKTNDSSTDKNETEVTFNEAHQSTLNITISPVGIVFSTTYTDWVVENSNNGVDIN